jgi:hypothetical protein
MLKQYYHACFRAPLVAALLWAAFGVLADPQACAAPPPRLVAPIYADYDSELREATARADGIKHVDSPALIQKLRAGNIKTYAYLVWHQKTDWDDFRLEFLPAAQAAGIDVWLYLTPPSENHPPSSYVPYGSNYDAWATNTAVLAQQYPVLKALAMDDFNGNEDLFTPSYVSNMMSAAHAWCSNLIFVPVNYDLSHDPGAPTRNISPAFANAYGPYIGGVILPYLNWANKDDFSDEADQIAANCEILKGNRAQFVVSFPSYTSSQAGDYAALIQVLTNAAGFPNAPFPFPFRVGDSYSGITTGYHKLQVLVDNALVWEGDTGGDNGIQDVTLNLQNQLRWKKSAAVKVRLYEAQGVGNYRITASWNLPAGNWAISETGAFVGTGAYYPATPGLNIPLVTMIYDGGYGGGTNHWAPTTNYVAQANIIAQTARLAGHTIGIIQYCLDKGPSSQQFPIVQDLYGRWTAPPLIATQPQEQTALAGGNAIFGVTATGGEPLCYQWRFDGHDLPGATSPSYSLTGVQDAHSGLYAVLVTNLFGSALSSNALLTVVALKAWGDNAFGQIDPLPGPAHFLAIAAGAHHSLALRPDGAVLGWGDGTSGQCNPPAAVTNAVAIAAGGSHSLAILADNRVVAWGANGSRQSQVPPGLTGVLAIAAGTSHSLALRTDGTLVSWGDNASGQSQVPAGLADATAIAAGGNHSLALRRNGTVVAWGENTNAQGQFVGQSIVPWDLTNVAAIAAGAYHSLAVKSDGMVVAWGENSQGQCNLPAGLSNVVAVSGGGAHSLALTSSGTVVAWGANSNGQCNIPAGLTNIVAVAAGASHSLVLADNIRLRPRLLAPARQAGGFSLLAQTVNRKSYVLEYKDSLADLNWTPLPAVPGNGGLLLLTDPNATGPRRFYRVRQ